MSRRYLFGGLVGLLMVLLIGGAIAAYTLAPTVHAGSTTELPELGRPGKYAIGTTLTSFPVGDRPKIGATSVITGNAALSPRVLTARFWYPSSASKGQLASYQHDISRAADRPLPVVFQGKAIEAGEPITDEKFPLVVMSHGYGGWAEHFSFLGEHIASHGYVVASINHADERPEGAISFLVSFGNVLQNRALDQHQIIAAIRSAVAANQSTTTGDSPAASYTMAIDAQKVGLLGYSMGGYGAFRTAGAPYDYDGEGLGNLPRKAKAAMQAGLRQSADVQAMVALAPWGGAPDNRSWTADALGEVRAPVLIIAGNQDDVVDFDKGVRWLFDSTTGADRQLLVYREARHNIAGNAITDPDFPANQDFATVEYIREPVWRTERINAINQHFITAFLDLHLKNDADKAAYLNPPTQDSNDSDWQLSFGERLNGKLAGDDESTHWRGFQNRWALGLEMHRRSKGE